MLIPGFFQSTADKSDIVGRTAAASGLGDNHCQMVCIIFSGENRVHDLPDDHQGWIAGVVVDIFQSYIDCVFIIIWKNFNLIAGCAEGRFNQVEVNRRHLRAEDRILLLHLFRKRYFPDRGAVNFPFFLLGVPDTDRSQKRTNPDSCRSQVVDLVNFQ